MEMYVKGFGVGGEYMRGRIHNSVSALEYGASYYVAPTVDLGTDADGDGLSVDSAPVDPIPAAVNGIDAFGFPA
jgi:hypothetical protein